MANAAKDKTFNDKGNEAVIQKMREFGVGSFASSKKSSDSGKAHLVSRSRSRLDYNSHYYSSDYDESEEEEDEFEKELQRRRM